MEEEQKRLEKEKERLKHDLAEAEYANQERSKYILQIARNIHEPASIIENMAALGQTDREDKDKAAECLREIEKAGQRLREIVNEITVMAELNDLCLTLNETPFHLRDMMERVIGGCSSAFVSKNLTLELEDADVIHQQLLGDCEKIGQILTNLLSNAVKYTPSGGSIQVRVREIHSFQGCFSLFRFEIEDTGIGMTEEFMRKMYRPFERGGEFGAGGEQGLGLGLTIALRMVRMMSGDMTVTSWPGRGTKVTVTLHIKRRKEAEHPKKTERVSLAGKRMLVAEDNELNAEMIKELLRQNGMIMDVAANGSKVLDMLEGKEENYYDCILMNMRMPVMNGYEAARKIRKNKRADLQNIPIVAMAAESHSQDQKKAKETGINAHISKPFGIHELVEIFTQIL